MRKIVISIILIMCIVNAFYLVTFEVNGSTLGEMQTQIDDFMKVGRDKVNSTSGGADIATEIATPFVGLGQILTFIGAGVMVGATAYMGIKYILASPEGQAKLKHQLIGLVVSGIVIFGAYGIWSLTLRIVSRF